MCKEGDKDSHKFSELLLVNTDRQKLLAESMEFSKRETQALAAA